MEIKLALIDRNPNQPRQELGDIRSLAKTIKANGLIEPIVVRKLPNKRYELIDGERRVEAMRLNGSKTIEAMVHTNVSDADSAVLAIIANFEREQMTVKDTFNAIVKLLSHKLTETKIATALGRPVSFVRKVKAVVMSEFPIMDKIESGRLNLEVAMSISTMDMSPQDKEALYRRAIQYGWRINSLRDYIKAISFELKTAPWDLSEPIGQCQACAGCQHRSDCQNDLFPDQASQDALCTNVECWSDKQRSYVESLRDGFKPYDVLSEILGDDVSNYIDGITPTKEFTAIEGGTWGHVARALDISPVVIVHEDYSKAQCYKIDDVRDQYRVKFPVKKTTVREHERTVQGSTPDPEADDEGSPFWNTKLLTIIPQIANALSVEPTARAIVKHFELN